MLRIGGVTLQLASQLRNVRIDRPAHDRRAIAPHRAEKLVPADDTPLPTQQRDEQIELLRRQLDPLARAAYRARADVDLDFPEALDHRRYRRRRALSPMTRPPNQRLDSGEQLEHTKGFRDVVVRAQP